MNEIDLSRAEIQNIVPASAKKPAIDVLRLDLIHPVVSGNKYFKLRFYIEEALQAKASGLITFGGAWSNHIAATAFLASQNNLATIGIIRGARPPILSPTLREAQQYGMKLQLVNRDEYRDLISDPTPIALPGFMIVPEGGHGETGIAGAATIMNLVKPGIYDEICCAVGTGTMLSGIIRGGTPDQHFTGISVLKGPDLVTAEIATTISRASPQAFNVHTGYHFGGYARSTPELLGFMREFYSLHRIGTDFVYTAKLFYAIFDLLSRGDFAGKKHLLLVHSGGMQGNRSLPQGSLPYG